MDLFYFEITSNNCKYDITVNDFTLFKDSDGLQLHTQESINHLIYNDCFVINIDLNPINNQTYLSEIVTLRCKVKSKNITNNIELDLFEYVFLNAPSKLPFLNINKILPIKKQKFLPAWNNGVKFEINEKLVKNLYDEYQKFWFLLRNGEISEISKSIILKEKTYSECYGISLDDRLLTSLSAYESHINDNEYELFKLQVQFFHPKLNCFGKVVSLQDDDGFHPTFFLKKDMTGSINIPLFFSMINNQMMITL